MARQNGKWYESRKLWIVGVGLLLIVTAALGGTALSMSESMIQTVVASLVGLVTLLTGAHAYTDVRLGSLEKKNELDQGQRDWTSTLVATITPALGTLATSLAQRGANTSPLADLGLQDRRGPELDSIETPNGTAFKIAQSELPCIRANGTLEEYVSSVLDFFRVRKVFAVTDPSEGPQRISDPFDDEIHEDTLPGTLHAQLLTQASSVPFYIVPGTKASGASRLHELPDAIETPDGMAIVLSLSGIPLVAEHDTCDSYIIRALKFLRSRNTYVLTDTTDGPRRVGNPFADGLLVGETPQELYEGLVEMAHVYPFYATADNA